jgi:hypothetical protein
MLIKTRTPLVGLLKAAPRFRQLLAGSWGHERLLHGREAY